MKGEPCIECGKTNTRGGSLCNACHARSYRSTPQGRAAIRLASKRYAASHPGQHRASQDRYRAKTGYWQDPGVIAIRRALRSLESALALAEDAHGVRGTGESGGDDGAEW
jgi:hypothetical protein